MSQTTSTTSASPSDADLLADFAIHRRQAAFAEVLRRHGGMVLSVCRSVLGENSDAEDAAQAVFLTLAQKAHTTSVQTHVVGWLHRVAWYVAARGAQAKAIRRRHEQEAARMKNEVRPPEEDPLALDMLHAGLAGLSDTYRIPLILHHLEGRSHEETAALVGCSVDAVAVRLHRGREMIRKRLAERGVKTSLAGLAGAWAAPGLLHLPPVFAASTGKAAVAAITGSLKSAAAVSGQTLALSKGAMDMLFWAKMKTAATCAAVVLLVAGVAGTVVLARGAGEPKTVTASPATQASIATGYIIAVTKDSVTLQRQDGQKVTATFGAATVIKVDDKRAAAADLKIEMSAAVTFRNGQPASEIRAYSPGVTPTKQ